MIKINFNFTGMKLDINGCAMHLYLLTILIVKEFENISKQHAYISIYNEQIVFSRTLLYNTDYLTPCSI